MFDAESYFNDLGIRCWTNSKNVSKGNVGIRCPFCNDHSNHGAVNPITEKYNCWLCGSHGLLSLIMQLEGCGWETAKTRLKSYTGAAIQNTHKATPNATYCVIPKEVMPLNVTQLLQIGSFFNKRYLNATGVVAKYNLHWSGPIGYFKYRIIIPVYYKGELCTLVGRDVTGKAEEKYLNYPNHLSTTNIKSLLYNIDNAKKKKLIIVEGPADVWRLGDGAVATFGIKWTTQQVKLIAMGGYEQVFIMYDNEKLAQVAANGLAEELSVFIKDVNVLHAEWVKDPGELSQERADVLMQSYGFR